MYKVKNFIRWALTHVDPDTVPDGADLPLPHEECGIEPWHYLYGTVKAQTTRARTAERWENHYKKTWTKEAYDNATAAFRDTEYATDCQGLMDAYLTYECGERTDINANMNYTSWCTDKGEISKLERPYVIGEALFCCNKNTGKMTHVGWICGFDMDGEPLVVEARGLWYGVVITRLESRPWTHRGLMAKKFEYKEDTDMDKPVILAKTSPMMQGDSIKKLQEALNALGYTDNYGNALEEDGKCGAKTMQAVKSFANAHADTVSGTSPIAVFTSSDGAYRLQIVSSEGVTA